MTLNFIENHRQKYFCTAHYLIGEDAKNSLVLTISQKRFFVSLDELALFVETDIKHGGKTGICPLWKLGLRTKYFWKKLKSAS